ncbi:SET domain-containing protein-lysine N-methyltransferase [Candidatus Parcubacteria bacterium]|nr:MAG: SET domain-containing protein-lysine N-methyltransferase [Candidatus Parcubacteria bacterium]
MLLVKTRIGPSKIHGIGLFADQFIAKGTLVQKFMPGFDLIIPESEIQKLSEPAREQFLKYAYKNKDGQYILCFDDTRFLNHSDNPNLISNNPTEEIDVAAQDIQKGEELTVNYKEFDADFDYKMSIH